MKLPIRNLLMLVLMLLAAGLSMLMRPTYKIADQGSKVELEVMIPRTFGEWKEEPQPAVQIIDPQQKEMLQKIYTQTLSRTYIDAQGSRVMLSIAYGEDQRDAVQLHYPEVIQPDLFLWKDFWSHLYSMSGFYMINRVRYTRDFL